MCIFVSYIIYIIYIYSFIFPPQTFKWSDEEEGALTILRAHVTRLTQSTAHMTRLIQSTCDKHGRSQDSVNGGAQLGAVTQAYYRQKIIVKVFLAEVLLGTLAQV